MKSRISDAFEFLICMIFPNRCKFCGKLTDAFTDICPECDKTVCRIEGEICKNCGSMKNDCDCHGRHGDYYEQIVAPFYYQESVRKCIQNYKFHGYKYNYKCLADFMLVTLKERYNGIHFDYVTYVPMRRKNERRRGFNQSKLLARRISDKSGIPFAEKMLVKLYDTKNQHNYDGLHRRGNVIGAFDVSDKFDIKGKNILLIDDIKTSGATLSECGKMLYLNDANGVFCLTAALRKSKIEEDD